jgi:PAS domain S-box-containing protein
LFNRTEPCEICETFKVLKTNEPLQWDWVGPNGRNYDIYDFPFTDRDGSEMILEMGIDITEKKLSQDVLKKQAAIMDLAHDAIFVKDLDNKIQFWNNGATDLYGYDANEAIGKITHELLKTKFPEQLEKIKDILYNKGSWEGELIHKSIDGLIIYVASRWSLLRDEHGKPEVILEINRDITEKRIADENSRVLADQYRAILATTTDGFWLCDIDGSIIDVNDTYCKISEYTNEELTGMKIWQLETMKNDSDSLQHINKVMKVGYDIFETQHRKKNGVIFDVEVAASFWESRELIIVFVRDISDRKKSEKALLRASIYSRTLIEASIDPLVTISSDGKITDVNNATEAVTGYPRVELIGTDFSDYFTEPDKARDVYKLVFQKGTVKDYELVIRHRFGHIFPVLYNATVYRDESGEVSGVFASARDMTELKRKEFALRESERNMMEAQRIAHLGSWQADFNSDDSKWYNVKWSDELYRILGYEPGEVRSSFELLIERINPEYRHLLGNFDNDTEGRRLENNIDYKITRIDGVERELFAKTEFIYDDSGRLIRAVGTVHDITDRKQIERELKKSYQYTRSLLEASLDPLVTINSEGKQLQRLPA